MFIYLLFLWPLKARRPPELFVPQWLPYCSFPVGRPFLFKCTTQVCKLHQHITIVYTGHRMACSQSSYVIKKIFGKAGRTRFFRLLLYLFSSRTLVNVSLTFLSLFLGVRGSFLEPFAAGTVGRLPSLTMGSKVMSFAFSEGSFSESAEPAECKSE